MKKYFFKKLCCVLTLILFYLPLSLAGSTPPLSFLSQETVRNMLPNSTQKLTYVIKNNVPTSPVMLNMTPNRTMLSPLSTLTTWQITDDCVYNRMQHYVPPGGRCQVTVSIKAGRTEGHLLQSLIVNYGPTFQTISPAPVLSFDVTRSATGFFFTVQPSGNNMVVGTTQTLTWTVKNTTANDIVMSSTSINFTLPSPLIAPPSFTNDCGGIVTRNGGVCNISTTIQALNTPGMVRQYLSIPYNGGKTLVADSPTNFFITTTANTRSFTFINSCPYDVWLAFVGGGQIKGCATDADCDLKPNVTPGTFACDPAANAGAGICNWKNPIPPGGNYKLLANGGTTSVELVENVYPLSPQQHLVWSGVIGGRTRCTSMGCTTGDCGGGQSGCPVGKGLSQPAQQAEPTFQQESDFYDITGINGINIPMSIEPIGLSNAPDNPYNCGSTGILATQTSTKGNLGGCNWNFTPPSNDYIWVSDNGITCTTIADCTGFGADYACGLSRAHISSNNSQTTCGVFEGYWTANEVCGINPGYASAPFRCNQQLPNSNTFTNMFLCTGTGFNQSCYDSNAAPTCCGCQNWQDAPTNLTIPSDPTVVQQCNSTNLAWTTNARPTLGWYKTACPPFYVYPFDDKSSTFTCTNNHGGINSTNYRITYCPGGRTGAPPGVIPNP